MTVDITAYMDGDSGGAVAVGTAAVGDDGNARSRKGAESTSIAT